MKKWHPDKHKDNVEKATKMSMQINEAYEVILEYCNSYEYSFDEEAIKKTSYSPAEWWHDKFGGRQFLNKLLDSHHPKLSLFMYNIA